MWGVPGRAQAYVSWGAAGGEEAVSQGSESVGVGVVGGQRDPVVRELCQAGLLARVGLDEDLRPVDCSVVVGVPSGRCRAASSL